MAYLIDPSECQACGSCISECPQEAIVEGDVYAINQDMCVECGACADACPCGAIKTGPRSNCPPSPNVSSSNNGSKAGEIITELAVEVGKEVIKSMFR